MAQQQPTHRPQLIEHEHRRRFVDPEDLACPGCGERPVRCGRPGYWRVGWGLPAAQFSHFDHTALCPDRHGRPAEPIEVPR